MPCFRCGVRQTDPARGSSPWRRAVRDERQVLICPDCRSVHDWAAGLDTCASCGSAALQCRLGEIECRDCGHVRPAGGTERTAAGPDDQDLVTSGAPGLSEEVAEALDRVLRRRTPPTAS